MVITGIVMNFMVVFLFQCQDDVLHAGGLV